MKTFSAISLSVYLKMPNVVYGLIAIGLIALCCALLGVCLVLRRYSLIGDGLSHVTFGTMAVAAATGVATLYISLPVTVLTAVILLCASERRKIKGDASVAMISVGALGFAYLVFSYASGSATDVCTVLFGTNNVVTMKSSDAVVSAILAGVVVIFYVVFYYKIFAVTFDMPFAQATGVHAKAYNLVFAVLTGIVIALGTRYVGALLITALIVFPTVSAMRVFRSFFGVSICAAVLSVTGAVGGMLLSMVLNLTPGATIVAVNVILFAVFSLLSLFVRRKKV